MRKLKLQMSITVDDFVVGPNGELDWMISDDKLMALVHSNAGSSDTILMGRKMTAEFIKYLENIVNNQPESPEYSLAKKLVDMPKIVFSKTVTSIAGKNVTVENGDLVNVVNKLKAQPGKDILVYGGAAFASSLIKEKLVNEFYFFVNPVLINKGLRIFELLGERQNLKLESVTKYDCGVAVLVYHLG
ncbi:MAG: dihydrofolate reductase family protein [Segetibacter sp.]